MPLNKDSLGKTYPPVTTEVTADAFQRYARACNDDNPRYFDASAAGGIVAPPMFAVVVTWLPVITAMTDPAVGADLLRLLHAAQDMEFIAPIRPGDSIAATATIAAIETHSGGETIALEIVAQNPQHAPVSRTIFTAFIRGRRGGIARAAGKQAASVPRGEPIVTVAQMIDRDQTFRYAAASGDRNPIHVDEGVAQMAGLPGIIVHGLCTMAFTSKVMIDGLCGGDPTRLKRLAARFSRPVLPGDTITTQVWPDGERDGRRAYAYETYNPQGIAAIREGIAEIVP